MKRAGWILVLLMAGCSGQTTERVADTEDPVDAELVAAQQQIADQRAAFETEFQELTNQYELATEEIDKLKQTVSDLQMKHQEIESLNMRLSEANREANQTILEKQLELQTAREIIDEYSKLLKEMSLRAESLNLQFEKSQSTSDDDESESNETAAGSNANPDDQL